MRPTHINDHGEANMVDISEKPVTRRSATARGCVHMLRQTLDSIATGSVPKGDVFATARISGIMAAKKCGELIPLCHCPPLESVEINFGADAESCCVKIEATALCTYKTGVEMEALTAVSVAALTIYDMCKGIDKTMTISQIKLVRKSGGVSGDIDLTVNAEGGEVSG